MTRRLLYLLALPALLTVGRADACSIPVFRYALERWELSPYEAVVFHRGDVPKDVEEFLRQRESPRANLAVTWANLDGNLSDDLQKLWQTQGEPRELPWVVVRPGDAERRGVPLWAGAFDAKTLARVFDSPARQQLVAGLRDGNSAVFVLLLSGDRAKDEAAAAMLDKELANLAPRIKLPTPRDDGPRLRLALPLRVGFKTVHLRRDRPEEAAFVRQLLATEEGLAEVEGPILLPVFGRGRLLGSLHGPDLNAEQVFEAINFLCGECSCEVKELNPGVDLLLAADWPALFERVGPAEGDEPKVAKTPPPKVEPPAEPVEAKRPSKQVEATTTPARAARQWLWVGVFVAAGMVIVSGAWAFGRLLR